jgi:xanthine/uracil/vitamin C permease (AzgA family)
VPKHMIERLFKLSENRTNPRTEALAGLTTFLTMAYIIFVQPAVLSGKMFGRDVSKIEWKDYTQSIPAFLIVIGIPLSCSIADGLAPGFNQLCRSSRRSAVAAARSVG